MKNLFQFNKKLIAVALPFLIALIVSLWLRLRPETPESILKKTTAALVAKDFQALVNLADPIELERLHVTKDSVRQIMQEMLYDRPFGNNHISELINDKPDWKMWSLRNGPDDKTLFPVYIHAIETKNKEWKLNLSQLLETCCTFHDRAHFIELWKKECADTGILGVRNGDGSYTILDESAPTGRRREEDNGK